MTNPIPGEQNSDLDIHDPGFVADPYPVYAQLRSECPVVHSAHYGGFWLFTRYELVRQAALNWRDFTSSVVGVTAIPIITQRTEPQLPLELDPPLHSRYRALVNPLFAPARVAALRSAVEGIATRLLTEASARANVDAIAAYAVPLSVETMAAFTGLPTVDAPKWIEWIRLMFDVTQPEAGGQASAEFGVYIAALIAERQANPADDFIGLLLASEVDGQRLTTDEVHAFCTLLFGAGFETTADALSVMLHYLAEHPEDFARLRSEPALIPTAVEEFLRYSSPIQIFGRNASRDLEVEGRHIHEGEVVALSFASANRDESVFPDAERCIIDRTPNKHLTFGAGVHHCLGAPVARLELQVTLEVLTRDVAALEPTGDAEWKRRGDRRGLAALPLRITPA